MKTKETEEIYCIHVKTYNSIIDDAYRTKIIQLDICMFNLLGTLWPPVSG